MTDELYSYDNLYFYKYKKRCKHENGVISEWVEVIHFYTIKENKIIKETVKKTYFIFGYVFTCWDCHKVHRFPKHKKIPNWMKKHIENYTEASKNV